MPDRVLFVDDEPNILMSFRRQLHGLLDVSTAEGGQAGLDMIVDGKPFAVVVADMKMPGIDGIHLLRQVKKIAPETVRMMLTGQADMETAIDAVNEGSIFRFLTKPCPKDLLIKSLQAGVEQYRLITAEKELLEKTLSGSVKVLSDVLALTRTKSFGHAQRVRRMVQELMSCLGINNAWEIDVASMLSQIGCVTVPDEVLLKFYGSDEVTDGEKQMFEAHPAIGAELIQSIPRLGGVARIIAYQEKGYDGSGVPQDNVSGEDIPLGSRLLKLALDFDNYTMSGSSQVEALQKLRRRRARYDLRALEALGKIVAEALVYEIRRLNVNEIVPGMVLGADVRTKDKVLLVPRGHELTATLLWRLKNFATIGVIDGSVSVLVRADSAHISQA
ncbi:MAG TPA: HD domain-containing phosphohydrolase [bacterium]|nr:HD domain-containing phosphohydrolase [bacterium]